MHVVGDLEVGRHGLDVVVVLEHVQQLQQGLCGFGADRHAAARPPVEPGLLRRAELGLERVAHGGELLGRADDLMSIGVARHIVGAGFERGLEHGIGAGRLAGKRITPLRSNMKETLFVSPRLPPALEKAMRISEAVRLRLSVSASTMIATPPGP